MLATVTASSYWSGSGTPAAQGDSLVDRSQSTYYNAGAGPPQYVQLAFPGSYTISTVCLLVAQAPNGVTQHQLSAGSSLTSLQVVSNLNSYTSSSQWLNITFNPWLSGVAFLRLDTLSSPSWVAWQKFLVYGV